MNPASQCVYPRTAGEDAGADDRASRLIETPIGVMLAESAGGRLIRLNFTSDDRRAPDRPDAARSAPAADATLDLIESELAAYFSTPGRIERFTTPIGLKGTPFQIAVWHELVRIPPGETRSYADIARAIGAPGAVRAVGSANGANPIAVVVPCHRVIRSDGSLCGYGGGVWRKKWLLGHEQNNALYNTRNGRLT